MTIKLFLRLSHWRFLSLEIKTSTFPLDNLRVYRHRADCEERLFYTFSRSVISVVIGWPKGFLIGWANLPFVWLVRFLCFVMVCNTTKTTTITNCNCCYFQNAKGYYKKLYLFYKIATGCYCKLQQDTVKRQKHLVFPVLVFTNSSYQFQYSPSLQWFIHFLPIKIYKLFFFFHLSSREQIFPINFFSNYSYLIFNK